MKKLKVIKGWKSQQTAIKMQTLIVGGFYGIGKRSFVSLSNTQASQNGEIVHKSPVIECLVPPLHMSIKDHTSARSLAAAVPCLWPSLAGTAVTCPAPSTGAEHQQSPLSLLVCSLPRQCKVHLHSLSDALGHQLHAVKYLQWQQEAFFFLHRTDFMITHILANLLDTALPWLFPHNNMQKDKWFLLYS